MDKQALKPNFYTNFTSKVEEIVEEPLTEDQQALAYITHFRGWELMKTKKVKLEEYLDSLVNEAMSQGLTMNELGERTMVKELTKFVLNSFVNLADAARKTEDTR
jgi:hypothetical protein